MITPEAIRKQALRAYPAYLTALAEGRPFFPWDVRFGKRAPKGDYHQFAAKREALLSEAKAERGAGYTVELAPRAMRRYGEQLLPARIFFETEADYLAFTGKTEEAAQFKAALTRTSAQIPDLVPWLARHPRRALPYLDRWGDLLAVCAYFLEHPQPGRYARELPIPVHTKFIERHTGILGRLFDEVLPEAAIRQDEKDFFRRYGLEYGEPLLRARLLDVRLQARYGVPVADLSTPVSEFARLDWRGARGLIVENKLTFLTLPPQTDSFALLGAGFGVGVLRDVGWLADVPLRYWGDLDAQGFMILSQLRSFLPHARSFLMDKATLEAFRPFIIPGTPVPETDVRTLPHLTPEEHALFEWLAGENLRLEQERIPPAFVQEALAE
ncbi:MAG: Wadjet anti-phage system protein JetD domain-containing protein [Rhodothermales bacterium]